MRIISLKVIKSLQGKESHTNTQKVDQDIKFSPRRTWPPWSNRLTLRQDAVVCRHTIGKRAGSVDKSQLSQFTSSNIISGFKYHENRVALQDWITEFKFMFQIWHGLQPFFNNIIDPNQENCANTFGCVGSYKYKIFWNECLKWANIDVIENGSTLRWTKYIIIHLSNH